MRLSTKSVAFSIILIALGLALSPFYIVVGPTKPLPWQHMINVIAAIFLGPWYAIFIAFVISLIRNMTGTGTLFAFPGAIPGALVVGCVYYFIRKTDYAALTEPIGTAIGALLSALIVSGGFLTPVPSFWGIQAQWILLLIAFLVSSIPGSILGFILVKALRRAGFTEIISPKEASPKGASRKESSRNG